ncbi:MAG TPA: HAD family phosphatase [Mycobacteriales bacterium]|nr:HAD family phosphatase [Mycobacteriales bacterium]
MRAPAAAVLFDMDGILVDSEPVWYAVEGGLVERLGGSWGRHHQARCIGGTVDATCRYIAELTGTSRTVEDIQAEVMLGMVDHFRTALPVIAAGVDLVDAVRRRGVPTALVSSSFRILVDAALQKLGPQRFDVTVAGDEVSRGKPHPEPYLTACSRLGVAATDAVVVEDALNGVHSAEAAGCAVVVVPSVAPIAPAPGRWVRRSLDAVDADWLLSRPASLARDRLEDVEA